MQYWLLKSEPDTFGIDDLAAAPRQTTGWDGVRNFQARNYLRAMKRGDEAFFYHSSCAVPGIAGTVTIVRTGYPDPTAFDPKDDHHDPKSDPDAPTWYSVDVRLKERFTAVITLEQLRMHANGALKDMVILRRGNRLSVTPVSASEWQFILGLRSSPVKARTSVKSRKK